MGALIFNNDQILLIRRGREPLKGQWSLPGGCVETGERLEAAVAREVLEETGLKVDVGSVAIIFERFIRDAEGGPEYHYILIDFLCTVDDGILHPGDDSESAAWFPMRDLDMLPMTDGTLDVIRRVYSSGPCLSVICA